jgi:hypothetical protein
MPFNKFFHNLLNVLVQIANKMGLQKKKNVMNRAKCIGEGI